MKSCAGSLTTGLILGHFKQRNSHGCGRWLHNVAYSPMRTGLRRRSFNSVEQLIAFCGQPDNLRRWRRIADRRSARPASQVRSGRQPVFIGSGVTPVTIRGFLPHADGFVVGIALKVDGVVSNPVDPARVRALLQALE